MRDRLDDLHEHLLRAGLAPSRARRYVRELAEHRQDLAEHLEAQGMDHAAASAEADRRLGSFDALLLPMLAEPRFRSPASRWPALFFLVMPLLSLLVFAIFGIVTLILLAGTPLRPFMADFGQGAALLWLAAPVLMAWLTILLAHRHRTGLHWPALAALAAVSIATAIRLDVALPSAAGAGQIGLSLSPPALLPLIALASLALLPLLLRKAHG